MYATPPKSRSQNPALSSKTRSVKSSDINSTRNGTSKRKDSRLPSPAPTEYSEVNDELWKHFDWSELSTPKSMRRNVEPKTIGTIRTNCKRKLDQIDSSPFKTANLKLLVDGIRDIMKQKWKILLVYFDEDTQFPWLERPWSHKECRRWDVVDLLTRTAVSYSEACKTAMRNGEVICTDRVDEEILGLISHLLELGKAEEEQGATIAIKEWERPSTLLTMKSEGVVFSDYGYEHAEADKKTVAEDEMVID